MECNRLNKLLLHPQGMQTEKDGVSKSREETCCRKQDIVVSKIRVEGRLMSYFLMVLSSNVFDSFF